MFDMPVVHERPALPSPAELRFPCQDAASMIDSLLENSVSIIQPTVGGPSAPVLAIKRTYQPSVIRKKRQHGFLTRLRTREGRKILKVCFFLLLLPLDRFMPFMSFISVPST